MAETIKEFTNAEITQASLSNDGSIFTVFTNDANTTRVVREVQVQDSPFNSGDATFEVDGTTIGDSFQDSSGNVVVPPSKSLDIKLATPVAPATKSSLTFRHTKYEGSSQLSVIPLTGYEALGTKDSRFAYDFSGASLSTSVTVGSLIDLIPPLNSTITTNGTDIRFYIYQIPAENLYYSIMMDYNSDFRFFKTQYSGDGGPGSTNVSTTEIESRSYGGGAFDWKNNKLYYKASSEIKEFDLTKAGGLTVSDSTNHQGMYSTQSSYGTGAFCNNHYFYSYSSSVYVRNMAQSTGYGYFSTYGNGTYPRVIVLYNETENKFYVIQGYGNISTSGMYSFDASQTANTQSGYNINRTEITSNFMSYMNGIANNNNFNPYINKVEAVDTNLLSVPYDNNSTRLYKAENDGLTYTGTSINISGTNNTAFPSNATFQTIAPIGVINETGTPLPLSNYTISAGKVRTQGVEIT